VIWLIEEPETYMHPSLAYQSSKILDQLSSISNVIKTTHSLSFMPQSVSNKRADHDPDYNCIYYHAR
ncbi:hypothetical protein, partial [Pseudomonas chlororaphis]|uniref:hypothetical protein n=1 Tax=Pseudomonas chlororaphis TaxID=587753 RepID=UPI001B32F40A